MANYQGSITVKRRPKDGTPGKDAHSPYIGADGYWYYWDDALGAYVKSDDKAAGEQGIQGPVVFQKEWVQGDTHRYNDNIRDYIYVRGTSKDTSYWYTRTSKGDVTADVPPVGGADVSGYDHVDFLNDLAVKVLIAEEANLANLIFKQGRLISLDESSNEVMGINGIAGSAGDNPAFWAGGSYSQAIAGTAKAIIRHDGSVKFTDAEITGTIHATDGEFTGVINAIGGRIAGFRISGNSLTNQNSNGSFITDAAIIFRNDNLGTFVAIGGNVLPVITGSVAVARFENNIVYDPLFPIPNYGIIAQAKNGPMFENHAIAILGGMISGFAIKVRQIDSSTTLQYYDVYVSCYNTSNINLYLPANPSVGKVIIAQRVNEASITFYGNGNTIKWGIGQGSSKITTGSVGDSHIFIFDGQFWHYNYWIRQPS